MTVFIANQFIAPKCIQTEKGIPCKLWESNFSIWLSISNEKKINNIKHWFWLVSNYASAFVHWFWLVSNYASAFVHWFLLVSNYASAFVHWFWLISHYASAFVHWLWLVSNYASAFFNETKIFLSVDPRVMNGE